MGVLLEYSRVRARQCVWVRGWSVSTEAGEVAEGKGLHLLTIDDG